MRSDGANGSTTGSDRISRCRVHIRDLPLSSIIGVSLAQTSTLVNYTTSLNSANSNKLWIFPLLDIRRVNTLVMVGKQIMCDKLHWGGDGVAIVDYSLVAMAKQKVHCEASTSLARAVGLPAVKAGDLFTLFVHVKNVLVRIIFDADIHVNIASQVW